MQILISEISVMQVGVRLLCCFLIEFGSSADPQGTGESDSNKITAPKLTPHPSWVSEDGFYSEANHSIRYDGLQTQVTESQWAMWRANVSNLPFHEEVEVLFLNRCHINVREMEYFSAFKNIESVTLGHSIEGVITSSTAMAILPTFENLNHLHISIHGLSDKHLLFLKKLPKLQYLTIEFPSKTMLSENQRMVQDWRAISLTENAAFEIAEVESLSSLMIFRGPSPDNGRVEFTEEAINRLVTLPNLEELYISADKIFKSGEFEKIERNKLPAFVEFGDVEDMSEE